VIASAVGTTIEWYDFQLYSRAAALVFGKLFFPRSDPLVGVMQAFGIYFVGYLARPVGAAIFGHFGDRIGRKKTLITTFAGVGADIRSDLYSLGITLCEMVTGKTPFQGTPGEVLHQHLHAPLPLEELEGVPQPLIVLLEALLEKDPGRRFQDPGELPKAIPTITERIEAGRRITREGLHKMPRTIARGQSGTFIQQRDSFELDIVRRLNREYVICHFIICHLLSAISSANPSAVGRLPNQ
jgi:serine/threonine protein kinase